MDYRVRFVAVLRKFRWFFRSCLLLLPFLCFSFGQIAIGQKINTKRDTGEVKVLDGYDWEFKGDVDAVNFPDFVEGPHFFWIDSTKMSVWYIQHDHEGNTMEIVSKGYKMKKDSVLLKGFAGDKKSYWVWKKNSSDPFEFDGVKKILAIGDVHGEYDVLVDMLKSAGVVDARLNWKWGKGHLVFIGDIFDRGSQVTECLWLIRNLEQQARMAGGIVHYLLGNHEIMVLMKDTRYASPKYKNLCKRLVMNYYRFYQKDTELGRWLRNRNCAIRINDLIFVHGGLAPQTVEHKLSLGKINRDVKYVLNFADEISQKDLKERFYYPWNPLWYRGYLVQTRHYDRITPEQVDSVLQHFHTSHIIFGHTEVDAIRGVFDNKLVAIDVPMGLADVQEQMLLIEEGRLYRLYRNGNKEIIE